MHPFRHVVIVLCVTLFKFVATDHERQRPNSWTPSRANLPTILELSIEELQSLQAKGVVSSVDLVGTLIQRIDEVNQYVSALSEINPDALSIAQSLDEERKAGRLRGPLHGIPILVKDNIATADRLNNTAGSFALLGATVKRESSVVTKLRKAGAVVLGKATTGEWAQYRSSVSSSSHGWSPYGGQTLGAYYPLQDPSGSSSGSAVAATLGLAIGTLATETSGSILLPAEKSNVVGIKPTLGLTSRDMVIPISRRQDTLGPHAKSVKDAAYLLSVMAGSDRHDNWTSAQPFAKPPKYELSCDFMALSQAKVGVPRNGIVPFVSTSTEPIMDAFEGALTLMKQAGAEIYDHANFASFEQPAFTRNSTIVLDTDFASGLKEYLSNLVHNPNQLRDLRDVLDFTRASPSEAWPDRDVSVWERILDRNITSTSHESRAAYQANIRMAEDDGVVGVLDKYGLDALVMPTFTSFHLPAIAGLPVVTVPLGFFPSHTPVIWNAKKTMISIAPGIPFGISFVGRKWSEEKLIALAYAFEQRTQVRRQRRPFIAPKYDLSDHVAMPNPTKVEIPAAPSPEEVMQDQHLKPSMSSKLFRSFRGGRLGLMLGSTPKAARAEL